MIDGISYNRETVWPVGFKPSVVLMPPVETVETIRDLLAYLRALASSRAIDAPPSLERYLSSFQMILGQSPHSPLTPQQLAHLLAEALDTELPADAKGQFMPDNAPMPEDMAPLRQVLNDQLSELRQYAEPGVWAVDWANDLPEEYLAAAAQGYEAHCGIFEKSHSRHVIGRPLDALSLSWRDVADLLSLGKSYE
jgi:hypothetical protein